MGKNIQVSKPISVKATPNEIYDLVPLGGKKVGKNHLIFLNRSGKDVLKTADQREKIFCAIWEREHHLKNRSVVEVSELSADGTCKYSYNVNGKLVCKEISLKESAKAGAPKLTYYKVQELSLRQFRQVRMTHAIVAFIKAIINLLSLPFSAIYNILSGAKNAPREFASMLAPIEHDRVGEVKHDAVLSQLKFMGRLFAAEDTIDHSRDMGLEKTSVENKIWFEGGQRPCKDSGDHYKIWIEGDQRVENRYSKGEKWEKADTTWLSFNRDDPFVTQCAEMKDASWVANMQNRHYKPGAMVKRPTRNHSWDFNRVQIAFHGEWVKIPKQHDTVRYNRLVPHYDNTMPKEHTDPAVISATQQVAGIFGEAHAIGKEMHEALNSGSKKKSETAIGKLADKLYNLPASKHFVLPLAQGEGRNYVPHFLVFAHDDAGPVGKTIVKHVCLSSTSLEKGRTQVVTTYDVTATIDDTAKCESMARMLFSTQSYKRKKDTKEAKIKGPMVLDKSLDSLLLHFGFEMPEAKGPVEKKTSRDPVKALYEVVNQLGIKEHPFLSLEHHTFDEMAHSKGRFYQVYVNHLLSYYEENESKLAPKERERALDGILWYAQKVRHYVGKEVNADAALSMTDHLIEFVQKKLDELGRTEALEQKDVANLKNKASLFQASLVGRLEDVMERPETSKEVEGSRVSPVEWGAVNTLRQHFENTKPTDDTHTQKTFQLYQKLLQAARGYLNHNNALAAKTLLLGIAQALPPADDKKHTTFWDTLSEQELTPWVNNLATVAEMLFEASLRSGTYPLKPHEVFELNVVIPLIQRHLFTRKIPFMLTPLEGDRKQGIEGIFQTYKNSPQVVQQLDTVRLAFIKMREQEIEEYVKEMLAEKWQQEDARDASMLSSYNASMSRHKIAEANYEKYKNHPDYYTRMQYRHPGSEPQRPNIRSADKKKQDREKELKETIEDYKRTDSFLKDLKAINVRTLDSDWNHFMARGHERTQAVLGQFARIMGISKDLYAYKIGRERWVGKTFDNKDKAIWLMQKDCSVLVGSSPAFENRYGACKRCLENLEGDSYMNDHALYFLIGYDNLGDGTRVDNVEEQELKDRIGYYQKGFFNAGRGVEGLVPEEMAPIRKVDEMRKVLREPIKYLENFSSGGLMAGLAGMFNDQRLSAESLRKKFAGMSAIHLVATSKKKWNGRAEGYYTLSTSQNKTGSLAVNKEPEEAATHHERKKYMGQISPEMAGEKVGADNERKKVDSVHRQKFYKELDPVQEFILRETDLSRSGNAKREDELSYLAVSQCMHFIYQYPEKLELPAVQHKLHKTFFQQGLIKNQLRHNPEFFLRFGTVLNEICLHLQSKGDAHVESEIFLREVCERIRRQAIELKGELEKTYKRDWATEISKALPAYDKNKLVDVFRGKFNSDDQKIFATFALSYFCHNVPAPDAVDDWRDLLNAFCVMQQSPFEIGHSGMQAELLHKVQQDPLPRIAAYLAQDDNLRNELLRQLSLQAGEWKATDVPYVYTLTNENGDFKIDLRTGNGFNTKPATGTRCKLPQQILDDENFRFLFQGQDPTVISKHDPASPKITDYHWKDDKSGTEFKFRYRKDDRNSTVQIFQIVRGKTYQFQKLELTQTRMDKLWQLIVRHNNKTVEEMIQAKGCWIYVDAHNKHDTSKVMVAQHGLSIEKDPITLNIRGRKIASASIGKGKDRKWICAGLSSRDSKLLSFRSGGGLLLLSKDRAHVDEIRFPPNPVTKEQLTLKLSDKKPGVWVVSGREDWEWQLTNTKTYEERFGKNWREYILPLKKPNKQDPTKGDEEIWVFPHFVVGGGKRGTQLHFLKSAVDFIDHMGGSLTDSGIGGVDVEELRMTVGAAESFMGGADGLVDAAQDMGGRQANDEQGAMVDILKSLTAPKGMRYNIINGNETSSHAGFFYLAYLASLRGEWASASRYLQLMVTNGSSSPEDLKQLQKMAATVLTDEFQKGDPFANLFASKSPLESAFRAKAAAALITLNTQAKTYPGIEVLNSEEMVKAFTIGGANFYLEYRKALSTHFQQFQDCGLIIDQNEEKVFTANLSNVVGAAAAKSTVQSAVKPKATPVQFDIPTPKDMREMTEVMANFVQPYGVWSIHDLHKQQGSYPKWETVLANFWSYWEWIYRNDLAIEDIAFLLRDIPPLSANASDEKKMNWRALHTARRTLLLFWHYAKQNHYEEFRTKHGLAMEANLREVKNRRLEMPEFAQMAEKSQRLKQEAAMSPGIIRGLYAKGYEYYLELMRKLNNFEYTETIGGVEHKRGIKKNFVESSCTLLDKFLSDANKLELDHKWVIHPDTLNFKNDYEAPKENKKLSELEESKELIWNNTVRFIIQSVNKSMPMLRMNLHSVFEEKKAELKPIIDTILDLPEFESTWTSVETMLPAVLHKITGVQLPQPILAPIFKELKGFFEDIHSRYICEGGVPASPYPRKVNSSYEDVAVKPSKIDNRWGQYFTDSTAIWNTSTGAKEIQETVWDKRKVIAKGFFNPKSAKSEREKYKLEKTCKGIDDAAEDLKKRTGSAFKVRALDHVYKKINANITVLDERSKQLRERVLDFARLHASELGIMYLFADRTCVKEEQIVQKVFDLFRYGELSLLDNEELQTSFAELITDYILTLTEMQQYTKAKGTCKDLAAVWHRIQDKIPVTTGGMARVRAAQSMANQDVDWLLYSADLKRFLEQGANRLRYAEQRVVDGNTIHVLKDQKFTRRYLVSDARNQWICREKAITSLEEMLKDMTEKGGDPVRFIKAKMGTGKSDFIFPEAIDLLINRGYEPVMVTTDALVDQLKISMGHKAYVFQFSIDFGLDRTHAYTLDKLGPEERKKKWAELNTPAKIEEHLQTLAQTLKNLKAAGKAVLTSPSQIAALRDKRVQLQGMLEMMNPGEQRRSVFAQLQLLKEIEAHFKKEGTIYLVDEDVNFDIAFEYNFATGEYRTVEPIRFDVAERFMRTIKQKHKKLWDLIVDNNLRAVRDVVETFGPVAKSMFHDTEFWENVGWSNGLDKTVNEKEFVDFVLGLREELPKGMPEWDPTLPMDRQQGKAYVGALKTFFSKTLESVRGVNPKLERGISEVNGVTAVPFSDGKEKVGVLYGEESENILHHMFLYAGIGSKLGEEIFLQKKKDLGGLDVPMSPLYKDETWSKWQGHINKVAGRPPYNGDAYQAFVNDKELVVERLQFLRHLMLDTDFIRVYHEQITFNSQDLGIGVDVRIGSGTGDEFGLNRKQHMKETSSIPDTVLGETLLCMDLTMETEVFTDPLAHMDKIAQDKKCHAILNYDYEVLGNNSEKLADRLRNMNGRQMIYPAKVGQQNEKKIWNPGEHAFPMSYEPGAINRDTFAIYPREFCRGWHVDMPRGGDKYGMAYVGIGNQEDPFAQMAWRLRHLDMGHAIRMAHDEKTERQVRKVCGERKLITDQEKVSIGHCVRYFTMNTLGEEDVKNVKATIFKQQTPLKTHIDAEIRKRYDLTDIQDTACLEEIEGKAVFKAARGMYIMSSRSRWEKEYQAHKTTDPITFVKGLCEEELTKIEVMKKEFVTKVESIVNSNLQTQIIGKERLFQWLQTVLSVNPDKPKVFEEALTIVLQKLVGRYSPEEIGVAREILRKYYAVMSGFYKAKIEINKEKELLETSEYQQFLIQNLPKVVSVDLEDGTRNEQKIQQMQEQKRQQKQEKTERVMKPGYNDTPATPIDFEKFKNIAQGGSFSNSGSAWYPKYEWHRNGHFKPLKAALYEERYIELPSDYDNIYVSERAWKLLKKIGDGSGAPAVELMVYQNGDKFHTCIIAPSDREQSPDPYKRNSKSVADALIEERKNPNSKVAIYPLSNENFSRMIIDCVKEVDEKKEGFIHAMVMSKLYLNWPQFTLDELDYLVKYLSSKGTAIDFSKIIGMEIHKNLETGVKTAFSPKVVELIKKILEKDQEWILKVAMRKLNAKDSEYPKHQIRAEEIAALEQWVKENRDIDVRAKIRHLRDNSETKQSALLLSQIRDRIKNS